MNGLGWWERVRFLERKERDLKGETSQIVLFGKFHRFVRGDRLARGGGGGAAVKEETGDSLAELKGD